MSAQNTWRRWTVLLVVGLALLAPVTIFSGQKHKKKTDKLPQGTPVLWRAPADISKRDLYWGQGGMTQQPDLSRVTLIAIGTP